MAAAENVSVDPLIGRTIEGYHFIKRLGEGSYGLVYLARHPRIKDRLVAVKYLKLGDAAQTRKIEREVDILARLQHPNVVDIYDTYRFDHYQLIVMELIRGGSLHDSLQRLKGLLDLSYTLEVIEQLAYALGYVHDENILHLDLKPANVLLDPIANGALARPVLTDFGIAQIVNPGALLSTNFAGTPVYMSPEHFGFGDNKPDRRSDIYSLGIMLFELVTGHPPYVSNQLLDLLNQHAYTAIPLPSAEVPNLPPGLDEIIQRAMAKQPNARYQHANEMGAALRELRLGAGVMLNQSGIHMRVSAEAMGAIAQQGADAMAAMDLGDAPRTMTAAYNLLVMRPDGSEESHGFSKPSIVIGRETGVDLVLPEKSVSRRHAQVDIDPGGSLYITDLQSANGTYLDGVRLSPQARTLWRPTQFVQVQGFLMQIDGLAAGEPLAASASYDTTNDVVALLAAVGDDRKKPAVRASLSPAVVMAEPGKPQRMQLRVTPENVPPARYEVQARNAPGVDERWYTLPAPQTIVAGETHIFDLFISAPPGAPGGSTHEITLLAVADQPDIPSAFQILKVRVVAYTRFTVTLQPSEVSHHRRRRADLTVTNTGNQPETFTVDFESPDTLQVSAKPSQFAVLPGEERSIPLTFKPVRESQRTRSRLVFTAMVSVTSGANERVNGTYVFGRKGRAPALFLPLWAVIIFVMGRWVMWGVPLPDQWAQFVQIVQSLIAGLIGRFSG